MANETELQTLLVKIIGDAKEYLKTLKEAQEGTEELVKKTEELAHDIEQPWKQSLENIKGIITETLLELPHQIVDVWKEVAPKIDHITKAARRLGTTTEDLIGIEHAGVAVGSAIGSTEMALRTFNQRLGEVTVKGSHAEKALKRIGIEAKDLVGQSLKEQIGTVAEGISHLHSQSEKAAVAFRLFGRSGQQLLPALQEGREHLAHMAEEAGHLGITFTDEQGRMVEAAQTAIAEIGEIFEGLKQQLVITLAPVVREVAEIIKEWAIHINLSGGATQFFANILGVVLDAAVKIRDTLIMAYELGGKVFDTAFSGGHVDRSDIGIQNIDATGIITYRGESNPSEWLKKALEDAKKGIANAPKFELPELERPKNIEEFGKQLEEQLRHMEIEFGRGGEGPGSLSKEQIKLQQQYADLQAELRESGAELTAEEKDRLNTLYEEISAVDKQLMQREEEKKKAKEAAAEQKRLAKEKEKYEEDLKKKAIKAIEDSFSPVQKLKKEIEEIKALEAAGGLTPTESLNAQNAAVRQFASQNVTKATAGSGVVFGSAESDLQQSQKTDQNIEKGIWKLVDQAQLGQRVQENILAGIRKFADQQPQVVAFPGG